MLMQNNPILDFHDKKLKSALTFFSRWRGRSAELWELTFSMKSLRVLIRGENSNQNLLIVCLDPINISSPVRWNNCDFSLIISLNEQSEKIYEISDTLARVKITCFGIEVKENVKLW
mgnify:CR=1 FL=1